MLEGYAAMSQTEAQEFIDKLKVKEKKCTSTVVRRIYENYDGQKILLCFKQTITKISSRDKTVILNIIIIIILKAPSGA